MRPIEENIKVYIVHYNFILGESIHHVEINKRKVQVNNDLMYLSKSARLHNPIINHQTTLSQTNPASNFIKQQKKTMYFKNH